jgi:tetratricopeptide (TPR) repeat protein
MPSAKARPSRIELGVLLGAEAAEQYQQLLRVLKATRGRFAFIPLRSNLPVSLRDVVLAQLDEDLQQDGIQLSLFYLSREDWDPLHYLPNSPADTKDRVYVLLGLEDTPEMWRLSDGASRRPPALDQLNRAREALRVRLRCPLVVWCDPNSYDQLQEHAPDLFDHYIALPELIRPMSGTSTADEARSSDSHDTLAHLEQLALRTPPLGPYAASSMAAFYRERMLDDNAAGPDRAYLLVEAARWTSVVLSRQMLDRLTEARDYLEQALTLITREDYPLIWASAQALLGSIYIKYPGGNIETNQALAEECYKCCIPVWETQNRTYEWAVAQLELGNIYSRRIGGERLYNLQRAITCYSAALTVWNEEDDPYEWANVQLSLGIASMELPDKTCGDLHKAIEHYENALKVLTERDYAHEWAVIQLNRGITHAYLARLGDSTELWRAIESFEACLRVRTEHNDPDSWARIKVNLGVAYSELELGDRIQNLRRAVSCYRSALTVWTENAAPALWAEINERLASALFRLAALDRSEEVLSEAWAVGHLAVAAFEATGQADRAIDAVRKFNVLASALGSSPEQSDSR